MTAWPLDWELPGTARHLPLLLALKLNVTKGWAFASSGKSAAVMPKLARSWRMFSGRPSIPMGLSSQRNLNAYAIEEVWLLAKVFWTDFGRAQLFGSGVMVTSSTGFMRNQISSS